MTDGRAPRHSRRRQVGVGLILPPPPSQSARFQLRIELVGSEPPIWRRLSVPGDVTLDWLHEFLQAAFGWTDSHLHRFSPTEDRNTPVFVTESDVAEGVDGILENTVRLDQLVSRPGDTFYYTYDFGDDWAHRILVEAVEPLHDDDLGVRCLAGERAAPPEDVGGIGRYEELLGALRNPDRRSSRQIFDDALAADLLDWTDTFDLAAANRAIRRVEAADDALRRLAVEESTIATLVQRCPLGVARHLAGFVATARAGGMSVPTAAEAEAQTAVFRTFLRHVPADGIALTSAGYLPAASVAELMAELDSDKAWPGTSPREFHTRPLLNLRECVTALGLVRKHRGRLTLTAHGERVKDDPVALWQHIAARLPVERTQHGREIGLLLLLLVASGEASPLVKLMEDLGFMTLMIGWEFGDGAGGPAPDAYWSVDRTASILRWIGQGSLVSRDLGRGIGGPSAKKLARAALGGWEPSA